MPLTEKGSKILAAMQEQYGEEEGKRVFYASKNAGTIEGVDKEFSGERRKELAKKGKAMSGGSYPIENKSDLGNAIQAFGRAKNKAATKAWIKKRASELGATEMLPENWDAYAPPMQGSAAEKIRDEWIATKRDQSEFDFADKRSDDDYDDDDDEERDDDEDDYNDRQTIQMTDAFVVDAVRKTKDGYLVANARIARTGIQLYSGHEVGAPDKQVVSVYRSPEEVFDRKAMRSMATLPVTLDHPPVMVDSTNWKQYAVGDTGEDVARDGECIRVPLIIKDAKAIEAYERDGICELSVGYGCELKWGRGKTPDGEVYDAKQTAIRGNHLAVVPAARGGSRLRIGDDNLEGDSAMPVQVLINDRLVEFKDELTAKYVQDFLASLRDKAKTKAGPGSDQDDDADDIEEERKKVTAEKDALNGEVIALKKQLEDAKAQLTPAAINARVKAHTELLLKANAAMDGKADFTDKDPTEIIRTVVAAHMGDAAKGMSDQEMVGAFRAITSNIKPKTGADRLADSLSLLGQGGGNASPSPKEMKDAAYNEYIKRTTQAWRNPQAA